MARSGNNFKRFKDEQKKAAAEKGSDVEEMRLNRFIARSGYCSRRQADTLIFDGHVKVNGKVEVSPGTRVGAKDAVEVNGTVLRRADHVYILMNKGRDTITSTRDEKGRKTVMDYLPGSLTESEGLFPVGRLDRNTEGCLLITNDGDLAHRLMHPSYEISKIYRVETVDEVTEVQLEALKTGIQLEDGPARADQVSSVSPDGRITAIGIHEGRNRQVRRMFEGMGHEIKSLERVQYAGLTTRGLRRGKWRTLENKEIKRLKRLVGLKDVTQR
ncbi:MAG: rRNA pseudouridine synthase [Rhodothermales bacterium]|nr:rRNA pseudouridine synthase [Rhodothermales bacterium]